MSNRDELAKLIYDRGAYCGLCGYESYVTCKDCREVTRDYADAVIAAGYRKPRTITTAEELDALPEGSAVVDKEGDVLTKHAHWWRSYETAPLMSRKVAKYGPLTVLYEPEA